jgi:predicted RNA binding protein YcfA (HicA-like mRNA interferase family)
MDMTGKELIKLMRKNGWKIDRISGSHHVLVKRNKTLTVPVHGNRDLKKGTLEALLKQGGLK